MRIFTIFRPCWYRMQTLNKMIKRLLLLAIIFITSHQLFAQIEITPYYGWQWTGSIPLFNNPGFYNSQNAKVSDKANYGVRLGANVRPGITAEFEWNHTNVEMFYRDIDGIDSSVPISANYYWLGFLKEFMEGPVVPFGIFNIGVSNFKNTGGGGQNTTALAVGFGAGIKYFMNDKFGLRLQARLYSPMQFAGISIGCGIGTGGGGCGTGVNSFSSIIQGDFTGGIILKLGSD